MVCCNLWRMIGLTGSAQDQHIRSPGRIRENGDMVGFDSRAGFAFGDIVLASYAMPHRQDLVQGPSVIISSTTYNQQRAEVLAMAIVSRKRSNAGSGEIAIQNAKAAGLDDGAALKPILLTLEQKLVRLILGRLDERDRQSLRHLLDLILGD